MEERLERMETMLSQLVGMVGNVITEQQKMRQEFESEKQKNADRHEEILCKFKAMELDQDFIREKTARNEREI